MTAKTCLDCYLVPCVHWEVVSEEKTKDCIYIYTYTYIYVCTYTLTLITPLPPAMCCTWSTQDATIERPVATGSNKRGAHLFRMRRVGPPLVEMVPSRVSINELYALVNSRWCDDIYDLDVGSCYHHRQFQHRQKCCHNRVHFCAFIFSCFYLFICARTYLQTC